jgi:nicotinic acid mononucleotide adenylyltransferase
MTVFWLEEGAQINVHSKSLIIYPGSFSPFHRRHLFTAQRLYELVRKPDNEVKIVILPVCDSYKKRFLIKKERYNIIKKILEQQQNPDITVSDLEFTKDVQPNTYHSMVDFEKLYPDYHIYMLCGRDVFESIDTPNLWDPVEVSEIKSDRFGIFVDPREVPISSTEIRSRFLKKESYDDLTYEPVVKFLEGDREYFTTYWSS